MHLCVCRCELKWTDKRDVPIENGVLALTFRSYLYGQWKRKTLQAQCTVCVTLDAHDACVGFRCGC